jgi:transposase, IS30 family
LKKKGHLTWEDVVRIETLLNQGLNPIDIAVVIGRDKSTIYRCIEKNSVDGLFDAETAWQLMHERKRKANYHPRIFDDSFLEQFIIEKITSYHSPEQIAGMWTEESDETLSHETIYSWLRKKRPDLIKIYLRRKGKKYRKKRIVSEFITDKRSIDERPQDVNDRLHFGHWEGDTMIGAHGKKECIVLNLERKSGLVLARKLPNKKAESVLKVTEEYFKDIPEELRVSVTYDNGTEFARHKEIEERTKMTVYFARPYSPWQKGSIENLIGLLRQFIPKGTDLNTVSEEELQHYIYLLNTRPRKRLKWKTPLQVFQAQIKQSCI